MNLRTVYLLLAIAGAAIPWYFFWQHIGVAGMAPGEFVQAVFATMAASGFAADLLISSLVFWIAMFREQAVNAGPRPWPFIILNLFIGLSCALPAWLYARAGQDRG